MPSSMGPRRLEYMVWTILVGLFFLIPIGYLIIRGIDFSGEFLGNAFSSRTIGSLQKTVMLATGVAFSTTLIGVTLAWLTTRTNIFGRGVITLLSPLPLAIPSYVGAVALILSFANGGLIEQVFSFIGISNLPSINGYWGAWFVLTLFTYPYVYLPTRARFLNMSRSQEESALLLGRGRTSIFFTVVLPQTVRSISSGALLVFLYTISDFGAVALLRYNTLTQSIFFNRLANQAAATAQVILLAVVGLIVVSGERYLTRKQGVDLAQAAEQSAPLIDLKKMRLPATLLSFGFFLVGLLGPILAMVHWVGRGIANRGRITGSLAISLDGLISPTLNTVYLGLVTGLVAMLVVFPVARYRSKLGSTTSTIVSSNFGLPGLIIALAMVYWILQAPTASFLSDWLYQTLPLMICAYILHFGAQAMGSAGVAIANTPRYIGEASQLLGAGRIRRVLTTELPLMAPILLTGVGLVMLSTMKELPITLLLSPPNFSTLATDIWTAVEERALAQAGLVSLILVAFSGMLSWLVIFRGLRVRTHSP